MLRRVIQDERRHFAFYRAQGKARPARAPRRTSRMVRWVFENLWTPVGAGVKSQEEVDALVLYLLGYDDEGREMFREVDLTISEIPGLKGFTPLEDYLDGALERTRRNPRWAGVSRPPAPADPSPVRTRCSWLGSGSRRSGW